MLIQTTPVVKPLKLWQSRRIALSESMDPVEFCEIYVRSKAKGSNGYFSACCQEISRVTGVSVNTVKNWGGVEFSKAPVAARRALGHYHQTQQASAAFHRLTEICRKLLELQQVRRLAESQAMTERHNSDRRESDELAIQIRELEQSMAEIVDL